MVTVPEPKRPSRRKAALLEALGCRTRSSPLPEAGPPGLPRG